MSTLEPDAVATDETVFEWSLAREVPVSFAVALVTAVVAFGGAIVVETVFDGERGAAYALKAWPIFAASWVLLTMMGIFIGLSHRPWLYMDNAGVVFAVGIRQPVAIAWEAMTSAHIRWLGPYAYLRITVRERIGRRTKFTIPLAVLKGGTSAVRAELERRGRLSGPSAP